MDQSTNPESTNPDPKPPSVRGRLSAWILLVLCISLLGVGAYLQRDRVARWWLLSDLDSEESESRKNAARRLMGSLDEEVVERFETAMRRETVDDIRIEILLALVESGASSLDKTLDDIQKGKWDLDPQSVYSIGRLGRRGEGALPLLDHYVHYGSPEMRRAAVYTAGRIGPAAVTLLFDALQKSPCHGTEHQDAVQALSNMPSEGIQEFVRRQVRASSSCRLVEGALFANSKLAVGTLATIIASGASSEVSLALDMMATMGPSASDAVPVMINMLTVRSFEVRRLAARAIGKTRIRHVPALRILTSLVKTDENSTVREAAVRAMGRMKPDDAVFVSVVGDALNDPALHVRAAAAKALGRIGLPAVVAMDALRYRLNHGDTAVRELLVRSLKSIGSAAREAIPELIAIVELPHNLSEVDDLREYAVEALGAIGTQKAYRALKMAAKDQDAGVQRRANAALSSRYWQREPEDSGGG